MASDLDIFRSANVLIREYGEDAELEAAKHADAMLEKGDLEGLARKRPGVRIEEVEQSSGCSSDLLLLEDQELLLLRELGQARQVVGRALHQTSPSQRGTRSR